MALPVVTSRRSVHPARRLPVLVAVVLVALVAGCASAGSTAGPSRSPSGGSSSPSAALPLVVGAFLPPDAGLSRRPVPLVVLVPGGSWLTADPSGFTALAQRLAAGGSAVVTTTYRTRAQAATFPEPVEDVVCAIDEAAAEVAGSGLALGPVVVVGASAGAQLAALAALVGEDYQQGCASPHVEVDGFVGLAGPYDLVALPGLASALFESTPTEDPQTWAAASPLHRSGARPDLPVLLVHGTADVIVPSSSSEDFAAALEAAGHHVTLILAPRVSHHRIYSIDVAAQPIEDFVESLDAAG